MNDVALIFIYNHQYNANIERLEAIYSTRFSHIFHLVPFYLGDKENVIPVYENSYYFQGYLAQGFRTFYNNRFKHYIFIADDLILNPLIDENNYKDHFKLDDVTCFIPNLIPLSELMYWNWMSSATGFSLKGQGVELQSQLPKYEDAAARFKKHGISIKPLVFDQLFYKKNLNFRSRLSDVFDVIKFKIKKRKLKDKVFDLPYPLVSSYSDLCVISADIIGRFCHFCGLFASSSLFVEIGLPTSLALTAEKIVQEKDLDLQGTGLWNEEDWELVKKYRSNLKSLLADFPEKLYIHPIKLSQWNK